jgi:hypothetical protein
MNKIKDKLQARAKFNKGKRVGYAKGRPVVDRETGEIIPVLTPGMTSGRKVQQSKFEPVTVQTTAPVKATATTPTTLSVGTPTPAPVQAPSRTSSPASTQPAPKAPPGYIQTVGGGFEKLIPNLYSGTLQTGIENKGVNASKPISKAQKELNEMNTAQQKALELAQTGQQPAKQSARMEREAMNPATGKLYTPEEKRALDASIDQRDFERSTQAQQTTSNRPGGTPSLLQLLLQLQHLHQHRLRLQLLHLQALK